MYLPVFTLNSETLQNGRTRFFSENLHATSDL